MTVVGMPETDFKGASPNAHFLIGEMPAPQQLKGSWWEGTGASMVIHILVLGGLIYAATHATQVVNTVTQVNEKLDYIFLDRPKPGPGGGGGGRPKDPEPPRKAEIIAAKPPDVKPVPKPADVPPPEIMVPIQTPQAVVTLPGALTQINTTIGIGAAGGGRGTGIGTGNGSGVGEGSGGGFGGGVYQIGNGVETPVRIKSVDPTYTSEAMRAKIQGEVWIDAIVETNGTITILKIAKSLDKQFGLDQAAIAAANQWRFIPGKKDGQNVRVQVQLILEFRLH